MKIKSFFFRKLENKATEIDCIETWCVKWWSLHKNIIDRYEPNVEVMSFVSEDTARRFAKELEDAARLLKNSSQRVEVYKQEHPNNL